jgi:hypothetical protein
LEDCAFLLYSLEHLKLLKILGFYGGYYEEWRPQGYYAVWLL